AKTISAERFVNIVLIVLNQSFKVVVMGTSLRLCRLMCGQALPDRSKYSLCPLRDCASPDTRRSLDSDSEPTPERHSLSAHRAAKPQTLANGPVTSYPKSASDRYSYS